MVRDSLRPDACRLDDPAPLVLLRPLKRRQIARRAAHRYGAQITHAPRHRRLLAYCIDGARQARGNFRRCAGRRVHRIPGGGLEVLQAQGLGNGRHLGVLRQSLGIHRSVIIAPSTYGTDNSCLFEALDQLGPRNHRAVVILGDECDPATLRDWHVRGVRGIRLYAGHGDLDDAAQLQGLAALAADHGWHLQLVGTPAGEPFAALSDRLAKLPCPLVFDHFGFAPQPGAAQSPTADALRRLVDSGHA